MLEGSDKRTKSSLRPFAAGGVVEVGGTSSYRLDESFRI